MKNQKVLYLTQGALIAALYVLLTLLSNLFGLASSMVQVRFSEALCILPLFFPAALPGLGIGCLISNLLIGGNFFDVIFGSIATVLGAAGTLWLGKLFTKKKAPKCLPVIASVPPILSNTIIIPFVLKYAYGFEPLWLSFVTVFAGEFISCGIFGCILYAALAKHLKPHS